MEIGNFLDIALKYGIWCACFLALALYVLKHYETLYKDTKAENNARELRYIDTINNITEKVNNKIDKIDVKVDKIQEEVTELKEKR